MRGIGCPDCGANEGYCPGVVRKREYCDWYVWTEGKTDEEFEEYRQTIIKELECKENEARFPTIPTKPYGRPSSTFRSWLSRREQQRMKNRGTMNRGPS